MSKAKWLRKAKAQRRREKRRSRSIRIVYAIDTSGATVTYRYAMPIITIDGLIFADVHDGDRMPAMFHGEVHESYSARALMWFCPSLTLAEAMALLALREAAFVSWSVLGVRLFIATHLPRIRAREGSAISGMVCVASGSIEPSPAPLRVVLLGHPKGES